MANVTEIDRRESVSLSHPEIRANFAFLAHNNFRFKLVTKMWTLFCHSWITTNVLYVWLPNKHLNTFPLTGKRTDYFIFSDNERAATNIYPEFSFWILEGSSSRPACEERGNIQRQFQRYWLIINNLFGLISLFNFKCNLSIIYH